MAVVVRVEELIGFRDSQPASDDDMFVELTDDPAVLGKMWGMILLLAIRDHATSVHYHPWREDGGLAYVVANVRHVLVPPPAELSGAVIAAARSVFTPAARGGLLARLGWRRRAHQSLLVRGTGRVGQCVGVGRHRVVVRGAGRRRVVSRRASHPRGKSTPLFLPPARDRRTARCG